MSAPRKRTDYAVVHLWGSDDEIGVAGIRRAHRKLGMLDIGFHFVITRSGAIETGRDSLECGNHYRGYNHNSIGICVVASSVKTRTPEQVAALDRLIARLELQHPSIAVLQADPQ